MKFLKIWAIALVATLGFISCEHENDWIEVDYSNDLVGTWTCFVEGYAEALVIGADGSVVSSGVERKSSVKNQSGGALREVCPLSLFCQLCPKGEMRNAVSVRGR